MEYSSVEGGRVYSRALAKKERVRYVSGGRKASEPAPAGQHQGTPYFRPAGPARNSFTINFAAARQWSANGSRLSVSPVVYSRTPAA